MTPEPASVRQAAIAFLEVDDRRPPKGTDPSQDFVREWWRGHDQFAYYYKMGLDIPPCPKGSYIDALRHAARRIVGASA